jgi:hypothetical protein
LTCVDKSLIGRFSCNSTIAARAQEKQTPQKAWCYRAKVGTSFWEWLGQNTSVGVSPETFLLLLLHARTLAPVEREFVTWNEIPRIVAHRCIVEANA